MKAQSKIFGKVNFRNLSPDLENEIIQRFNDYETMQKVMKSVSMNLITLLNTTNGMDSRDAEDIKEMSTVLIAATQKQWLKENSLYY